MERMDYYQVLKSDVFLQKSKEIKLIAELIKYLKMENNFLIHVNEWRQMNQTGRFVEARQFYFDELFEEVIENFENHLVWSIEPCDILFSILGFTPEPIILAARALKPRKHIIIHDKGVAFNEDNVRFLPKFLPEGYEKVELKDESFGTIYDTL